MSALRDLLRPLLPARVRGGGAKAGQLEFVVIGDEGDESLRATVHGHESHEVLLRLEPPEEGGPTRVCASCTCPLFRRTSACRHVWAVAGEADDRGLALSRAAGELGEVEYTPLDPRRELWRARLEGVHEVLAAEDRDPWEGQAGVHRRTAFEILYVLDLDDTKSGRGLVVRPFWRERAGRGWSRRRPYDPDDEEAPDLEDPLDRRVFRALAAAERSSWTSTAHLTRFGGTGAWWVGDAECVTLLPLLCSTRRAFLHHHGGDEVDPVALDEGEPWRFGLHIDLESGSGRLQVTGFLARGDERLALDEPHVCLGGHLFLDGLVARLDPGGAYRLLQELRMDGPLEAPAEDSDALVAALVDLPAHPLLEGEELRLADPLVPEPHLQVGPPTSSGVRECRLRFRYGELEVDVSDPRGALREPGSGRVLPRSWAAERAARGTFLEAGGEVLANRAQLEESRLEGAVLALLAAGWTASTQDHAFRPAGPAQVRVESGVDWFDLSGSIDFGGLNASLPALLAALEEGRTSIELEDGSIGLVSERARREWAALSSLAERRGESLRFASSQGWLLDRLLADLSGVDRDETFASWARALEELDSLEPQEEPPGFRGNLRTYQRQGLAWTAFLRKVGLGGCLADDMGLGKTVQVLALLEERRAEGRGPSLVVCPRSVVFHWREEAKRFAPNLSLVEHVGPERSIDRAAENDLVLTTYGTLRRDVEDLARIDFDYVVLDEAQAIKNASSHSAKAARVLRSKQRLALSGTPVENHLGELWSLCEFLNPGMLGKATAFRRLVGARGEKALDAPGRARLAAALKPVLLRRTKEQVLPDLPPKVEQVLWVELEERQQEEYAELHRHYRDLAATGALEEDGRLGVLTALLRLRQAACHPGLIDPTRRGEGSAKLDALLPLLEEIVESGHKALVFSQFTTHLDVVRSHLDEREWDQRGWNHATLDGSTRDREGVVKRFRQDGDCPVLLMSLKAGGLGLNLVEADYVFLLDPWWNPAAETQAIDRAHRIGRRNAVVAYRLIARGTVEEKVLELQEHKRELAALVTDSEEGIAEKLTIDDLRGLFG